MVNDYEIDMRSTKVFSNALYPDASEKSWAREIEELEAANNLPCSVIHQTPTSDVSPNLDLSTWETEVTEGFKNLTHNNQNDVVDRLESIKSELTQLMRSTQFYTEILC
uniref:Uncharacterized protein n=1 Tax=Sphaerodactylus townsendi TaxID=933632 RepID=A0ACB8G4J8_9SAUR